MRYILVTYYWIDYNVDIVPSIHFLHPDQMEVTFAQTYFNTQNLHLLNRVCYEENSSSRTLVDRDSSVSIMTRQIVIDWERPLLISAWSEIFVLHTASGLLYGTHTSTH